MNTDERILQILENSACLSKGQLLGYVKHTLYPEELRAVELHLSSCAFCNDALDGMALQTDPDKLLASLVPPPLPVISSKEKAREKKEQAATREEKAAPAQARVPVAKPDTTHAETDNSQRLIPRRNNFLKPVGIAAALVLGFGAFWYFELRPDRDQQKLAEAISERNDSVRDNPAVAADQQMIAAENNAATEVRLKDAAKKQKDSLLIAKREDAKRHAVNDSMNKFMAAAPAVAASDADAKGTRKEAETTGVADEQTVKNAIAAAPAMARKEEDQAAEGKEKKKTASSDYELGMQQYKQKNYASALLYFKTAESDKADPRHWDAVYYSALCNRNLNKDRKARKLLERIIEAGAPQKKSAQKQLDDMEKKK